MFESAETASPDFSVQIKECTVDLAPAVHPFAFQISQPSSSMFSFGGPNIYFFKASSEESMVEWVSALRKYVPRVYAPPAAVVAAAADATDPDGKNRGSLDVVGALAKDEKESDLLANSTSLAMAHLDAVSRSTTEGGDAPSSMCRNSMLANIVDASATGGVESDWALDRDAETGSDLVLEPDCFMDRKSSDLPQDVKIVVHAQRAQRESSPIGSFETFTELEGSSTCFRESSHVTSALVAVPIATKSSIENMAFAMCVDNSNCEIHQVQEANKIADNVGPREVTKDGLEAHPIVRKASRSLQTILV